MEDIILDFWRCSLKSDFSEFDWDEAFDDFQHLLKSKLVEHGLCSIEEFTQQFEDHYGNIENEVPYWATAKTDYIWFSESDVVDAILEAKHAACQKAFGSLFSELVELNEKLDDRPTKLPELIQLFDECIHAKHQTGMIIEDVDIEELREEAEQEYREECERVASFPTKIRELRMLP